MNQRFTQQRPTVPTYIRVILMLVAGIALTWIAFHAKKALDVKTAARNAISDEALSKTISPWNDYYTQFVRENQRIEEKFPAFSANRNDRAWRAGAVYRVPCVTDSTGEDAAFAGTVSLYIPRAYDTKRTVRFPWLVIQMPMGEPGFLGLESWAEQQEIILVAVDGSRNRRQSHLERNAIAQDACFATIVPTMRLDMRLGFAIGFSGGARSSWHLVGRYPDNFAGLVMMGLAYANGVQPNPAIRIAYIHGEEEPNNAAIEYIIPHLKDNGNEVREMTIPGGHVPGSTEDIAAMLDWMLGAARSDLGL